MRIKVLLVVVILIGVGLAGGGVYFLIQPLESEQGFDRYLPAAALFLFAVLVFVLFVPMIGRLHRQSRLLRSGEPATATIIEVRDTGSTLNQQPIFRFALDVRRSDGSTYRATARQLVARPAMGVLRPGMVVQVRVDPRRPHRVAIDSRGGATAPPSGFGTPGMGMPGWGTSGLNVTMAAGQSAPQAAAAWAAGAIPTAKVTQPADIIRDGVAGTATVRSAALTGVTLGQAAPPHQADPAHAGHPMVLLVLDVALADGRTVTAQGVHRVPPDRVSRLAPGVAVPVAYLPADPAATTCVDWDRLATT